MRLKTLIGFVLPSVVAMILLIALPLVGVVGLSLWNSYTKTEMVRVEQNTPTGTFVRTQPRPVLDETGKPVKVWEFYGLKNFLSVLDVDGMERAFAADRSTNPITGAPQSWPEQVGGVWGDIANLSFWGALSFTLFYTAITTPLVLIFGFLIALGVHAVVKPLKGPLIFASLLPFVITPVVGALSIKWLFLDNAVITVMLQSLGFGKIYFLQNAFTTGFLVILYGLWHVVPFAFIVLYAGLQTVPQDAVEAAVVDGASRWQSVRYVIMPHLAPLFSFVTLIHIMDAYRVFEPILVFSAGQGASSLQYLTYYLLNGEQNFHKASAAALLTVVGILLLLIPLILRTWRTHREGA